MSHEEFREETTRLMTAENHALRSIQVALWLIYASLTLMTGIFLGAVLVYINHVGR